MDFGTVIEIIQFIGIIIPFIGIFVLLQKQQTTISASLMVANIGCLIINACYLLIVTSVNVGETMLAFKMEYIGNSLFYIFFVQFILSYLHIKYPKFLFPIWMVVEALLLADFWMGNKRELVFDDFSHVQMEGYSYMTFNGGSLYLIRHCIIIVGLLFGLVYTMIRMIRTKNKKEKINLGMLCGAQAITITALLITVAGNLQYDVVPIFASLSVLAIILKVIRGEFFSVTDLGREYVFETSEDAFIIVDQDYEYLDSNDSAKKIFPELIELKRNVRIPEKFHLLFTVEEESQELVIGERTYERNISNIEQKKSVVGYSLTLLDITEQHKLITELKEAKEAAEEANYAKSSFLSNMSHEIRTPMNTIIGMSEIVLRGELQEKEKSYIEHIRNSGEALLMIINDILDFSKIESGKMEIIEDEYEPMSMINDLNMMFLTKVGEKNLEYLLEVDSKLPSRLYGDVLRIRQVLINLLNNAVKFTEDGFVKFTISIQKSKPDEMVLRFSVRDSGQGMKEEDLPKLFGSFQQVDTRKNRKKEGTGLGLVISKQLVELMGGEINVESTYGEGSEFYFTLPQKVINAEQAAYIVKKPEEIEKPRAIAGRIETPYLIENLKKLSAEYGILYVDYNDIAKAEPKPEFLFMDEKSYHLHGVSEVAAELPVIVLWNPQNDTTLQENLTIVNKPLYSLPFCQIMNHERMHMMSHEKENYFNFTAPEAVILIVDDNAMNLKVAQGLLQPLQMKIDIADSGKRAISMVQERHYDIVFMDHMMPDMDGIETTERIRKLDCQGCSQVPIIALTANAVAGAKEIFLSAGMDDFVSKPIEMKNICSKIKAWLPKEKIKRQSVHGDVIKDPQEVEETQELPDIDGLNLEEGIKYSGSLAMLISLLGDFYRLIDMKAEKIEQYLKEGKLHEYTIEVHALKNTARMIGASRLSELFQKMEQYGNEKDREKLEQESPEVLQLYRSYKTVLKPYGESNQSDSSLEEIDEELLLSNLETIRVSMDGFDLDTVDEIMKELEQYKWPENTEALYEELKAYVSDVAMEDVINTVGKLEAIIKSR